MNEYMHNVYGTFGEDIKLNDRKARTLQTLVMVFMADIMPKPNGEDPISEIMEHSHVGKILKKKMEVMHCPIEITDAVYLVLDICSNSSPGLSQILLHDLLFHANKRGYTKIGIEEFSLIYPMDFPIIMDDYGDYTEFGKTISEKWDEQKVYPEKGFSFNKVDTMEYWNEIFKEPQ